MRADRLLCGFCTSAVTSVVLAGCILVPPDRSASTGAHAGGVESSAVSGGTGGRGGIGGAGSGGNVSSGGASIAGSSGSDGPTAVGGVNAAGGDAGSGRGGATGSGGAAGGAAGSSASNCPLGSTFKWSSTSSLIDPMADGSHKDPIALRDPTVVYYANKFTLYATLIKSDGNPTLEAVSFITWPDSAFATAYFMDNNPSFSGSHAGPQLFYLAGQKKWYLLSQAGGPAYSTAADVTMSSTWTKPASFFASTPSIVTQNAGSGPGWTDFWTICDGASCYMFFANNNGYLFRSQTSLASFPSGFGTPVIVMKSSNGNDLYGGVSVYKVKGSGKYLLLVEAVGAWHYIRAWTGDSLDGNWTALADSEASPFAGLANFSFPTASPWTKDVAEGELVRDGYDETMAVNPCNLQYVYQGRYAYTTDPPAKYPWKLALATRAN